MSNDQSQDKPVDKDFLYGKYEAGKERKRKRQDWRERLSREAAHKALDIADDGDDDDAMEINQNIRRGMGLPELALLLLGMGGTAAGTAVYLDRDKPDAPPPAPVVQPGQPQTDYGVEWDFYQPERETDGSS